MTATASATNWRAAGACLSADPDLFFPISAKGQAEKGQAERQIARAKVICAGCRVRQECLEFAVAHELTYGIWGGTTPEDRQRERRRKRRQAAAAARQAARPDGERYRPVSQRSMQASSSSVSTGLVT
jgi:WhiB family transcriptional regulator, redox-sensing transcriptional regulator